MAKYKITVKRLLRHTKTGIRIALDKDAFNEYFVPMPKVNDRVKWGSIDIGSHIGIIEEVTHNGHYDVEAGIRILSGNFNGLITGARLEIIPKQDYDRFTPGQAKDFDGFRLKYMPDFELFEPLPEIRAIHSLTSIDGGEDIDVFLSPEDVDSRGHCFPRVSDWLEVPGTHERGVILSKKAIVNSSGKTITYHLSVKSIRKEIPFTDHPAGCILRVIPSPAAKMRPEPEGTCIFPGDLKGTAPLVDVNEKVEDGRNVRIASKVVYLGVDDGKHKFLHIETMTTSLYSHPLIIETIK